MKINFPSLDENGQGMRWITRCEYCSKDVNHLTQRHNGTKIHSEMHLMSDKKLRPCVPAVKNVFSALDAINGKGARIEYRAPANLLHF